MSYASDALIDAQERKIKKLQAENAAKLRELLDERGVEYTQMTTVDGILFNVVTRDGHYFILVRDNGTGIEVWSRDLTPEQAIAATLVPEVCRADETATIAAMSIDGTHFFVHEMECSRCGHTYEHVNGGYEYCPRCGRRIEV